MRYIIVLVILIAIGYFLFFASSKEFGTHVSSGVITYGRDTIGSVDATGFVSLDGTTVRQSVVVKGRVDAKQAQIGMLDVIGNANLTDSTVTGKTEIKGFLHGINSTFNDTVTVSSHSVSFQHCTVPTLEVQKTGWTFGAQQVVELSKKSTVGSIVFEAGNGKVILSEGSTVGSVVGGQIEKR